MDLAALGRLHLRSIQLLLMVQWKQSYIIISTVQTHLLSMGEQRMARNRSVSHVPQPEYVGIIEAIC